MSPEPDTADQPAASPEDLSPDVPPSPIREDRRPEPWPDDRDGREPGDLVAALSPRQIIGGFALLAGLILMLRRSRRKKG